MSEENNQDQNQDTGQDTPTWENILEGLPEEQQALYQAHTQGLRSALDKERTRGSDREKQIREAAKVAKGEVQEELTKLADQVAEANRRADFYREASNPEIGCASPELALLAAEKDNLFDRRGNIQWSALKEAYPVLFAQPPAPRGNAGNGTSTQVPNSTFDMDALIRNRGRA